VSFAVKMLQAYRYLNTKRILRYICVHPKCLHAHTSTTWGAICVRCATFTCNHKRLRAITNVYAYIYIYAYIRCVGFEDVIQMIAHDVMYIYIM